MDQNQIWEFLQQSDQRGNPAPPSSDTFRITENDNDRITENGDYRITEN